MEQYKSKGMGKSKKMRNKFYFLNWVIPGKSIVFLVAYLVSPPVLLMEVACKQYRQAADF